MVAPNYETTCKDQELIISRLEKENRFLREENQELKADYGTKAQVERDLLMEENQELKKQLEEWERLLINAKEMLDLQGCDGNYNYDSYMLGLYNGMEYIIALFEKRKPNFKDGKNIEFLDLKQKRNLINKFNKEYDEEDKKKNPNRSHAEIIPDAEEVYRRYYAMKTQQKEFIEWLEQNIENEEYCYLAQNPGERCRKDIFEEALSKYKEIIGVEKCEK